MSTSYTVMGHMSSLYTSVCVVIHNKGTGVDKSSWENETPNADL